MKRTINTVTIEGRVFDHSLQKRVTGPNAKQPGTEFIMGEVNVAVDDEGYNVVPVHFSYVTATGRKARTFDLLNSIIENPEYTWVSGGKENALKVSIASQVALNDFYTKNDNGEDELVSAKRVEGGFINEIMRETDFKAPKDRHAFTADMLITGVKMHDEVVTDAGEIYPAYATIHGYFFDFRGAILPVDLRIESEAGIQFFLENDGKDEPNFRKIWGHIDSLTIKKEVMEESAFGEASVRTVDYKVKKWVVDGCSMNPYEYGDPDVLDYEAMSAKVQERNVYLAEVKQRYDEYLKAKAGNAKPASTSAAPKTTTRANGFTVKKDKEAAFMF